MMNDKATFINIHIAGNCCGKQFLAVFRNFLDVQNKIHNNNNMIQNIAECDMIFGWIRNVSGYTICK